MITVDLDKLQLFEVWVNEDPSVRVRAAYPFPISHATGAKSSAVIYFHVLPGHRLGRHTDSAEETVFIKSGSGEAVVGNERAPVSAGQMVLAPAGVPHDFINTGPEPLDCVGFYSSAVVFTVFDLPIQPMNVRLGGTPPPQVS